MTRHSLQAFAAATALAALVGGAGPSSAGTVCIGGAGSGCPQLTDDPQPNVGDAAPGMIQGSGAGAPAMAPAEAATPVLGVKPIMPPPPPADLDDSDQKPDDKGTDGSQ
jgi:hypothetical protein